MRINDKVFDYVAGLIFIFVVDLAVCSLCMLFLDITFAECLIYSAINALWIPLVLPGIMNRLNSP
ncbi:MAG TPA: hypothetical protein VMV47_19400 [Bacteroidales bacterium]|nr:hypothetical protein [Bacteroidales bacterium]HUX97907.1 hypothetical protein [Bacteroidales bacterium]